MIRRRSSRHPRRRGPNVPKDKTNLLITFYLYNNKDGATPNELAKKATRKTQAADSFADNLEELFNMGWVTRKKVKHAGGYTLYTITEEGRNAIDEVKKIINDEHPLSKLSLFHLED